VLSHLQRQRLHERGTALPSPRDNGTGCRRSLKGTFVLVITPAGLQLIPICVTEIDTYPRLVILTLSLPKGSYFVRVTPLA